MKKIYTMTCSDCLNPGEVTCAAKTFWKRNADLTYRCPACARKATDRAVLACLIAKAETATRTFRHLNP